MIECPLEKMLSEAGQNLREPIKGDCVLSPQKQAVSSERGEPLLGTCNCLEVRLSLEREAESLV